MERESAVSIGMHCADSLMVQRCTLTTRDWSRWEMRRGVVGDRRRGTDDDDDDDDDFLRKQT